VRQTVSKIMMAYRHMHKCYKLKIPLIPTIYQKLIRLAFSAEIPCSCDLRDGVELEHGGLGIVIHDNAIVGERTKIYPNVVIGGRNVETKDPLKRRYPIIGCDCIIGAGAAILGGVQIGNNCKIGANAVVIEDIPDNSTAVGVPAHIIKKIR